MTTNQQPAQQEQNILAILGLVFCFIMQPVGLILSVIGLLKSREMNGNGRGFAIAGIIISIVQVAIVLIVIVVFVIIMIAAAAAVGYTT